MEPNLKTPETTIYRRIQDELVVVQLDTGHYFFFNPETQNFFDSFRKPQSLDTFCSGRSVSPDEKEYLKEFCDFLLKKNILKSTTESGPGAENELPEYAKPAFLREGEKTLDQISFSCP